MAEETPAGPNGGTGAVPEPASEPAKTQQDFDPGNFEQRFKHDPEFAWQEFRKIQSSGSRLQSTLDKHKTAIQVAEALGGGDPERGGQEMLQRAQLIEQMLQDPKLSRVLTHFSQTGKAPDMWDLEESGGSDDDVPEHLQKELSELRQTVTRFGETTAQQTVKSELNEFFNKGLGQYLEPQERSELLDSMMQQCKTWAATPQGRQVLQHLGEKQIKLMATNFLTERDLLEKVGERMALQKARERGEMATDSPSSVGTSELDNVPEFKSATEALRWAQRNI